MHLSIFRLAKTFISKGILGNLPVSFWKERKDSVYTGLLLSLVILLWAVAGSFNSQHASTAIDLMQGALSAPEHVFVLPVLLFLALSVALARCRAFALLLKHMLRPALNSLADFCLAASLASIPLFVFAFLKGSDLGMASAVIAVVTTTIIGLIFHYARILTGDSFIRKAANRSGIRAFAWLMSAVLLYAILNNSPHLM